MALTLSPTTFIFGCVRERGRERERERGRERERTFIFGCVREGERGRGRGGERERTFIFGCVREGEREREREREILGSLSMSQVKAAWPHTSCIAPTMILMIQQQACKRGRTK